MCYFHTSLHHKRKEHYIEHRKQTIWHQSGIIQVALDISGALGCFSLSRPNHAQFLVCKLPFGYRFPIEIFLSLRSKTYTAEQAASCVTQWWVVQLRCRSTSAPVHDFSAIVVCFACHAHTVK